MDTACADGMCPLCLSAERDKQHAEIRELKEKMENNYDEGYEQGYADCEEQNQ
jgi:flagellar biosynthesis/type III secretory pathway protein FliH